MNKKIPLLAGFLIPLLIAVSICIAHGVYPAGEQCILQVDMYHQYCPFFSELLHKIRTGGSIFYSWNIGLGADFVSLFSYYLASPLNILLLLCPREFIVEFMTILVLLKISFSGLAFTYYLIEHFGLCEQERVPSSHSRDSFPGKQRQLSAFAAAIFGCAYALSAFMAAYAWNIMWLDCMVLAPLVLLGLERMIQSGSAALYYVMLALCIWSNFYIAIMVCIFLVLWFLVYWLEHRETGIMAWIRFAWYSLLAGGTGAVLIFPTAIVLGYSGNQGITFPETFEWYFDLMSELARHLMLVDVYMGAEHWPNLYCGVFALVFLILYLLNRGISWKHKVPRVLLLVLFVVSFAGNVPDFFWHGLHFPTSLPGRQSFLYILLLLVLAFEAFLHIRENRLWHVLAAAAVSTVFIILAHRVSDAEMIEPMAYTVSAVFMGCYLVLIAGYLAGNAKVRSVMLAIGCFAIVAELTLNYDMTGFDTVSRTAYLEYADDYREVLAAAQAEAAESGETFYRVEELERKTKNDAGLYGYRSATQFSSLMNLAVSHFYQDVGMEGGKNFYCVNGATPLLSAMLSVRYVLADNELEAGPLRRMVASAEGAWIYENQYVLPLGFMMSEDVIAAWDYEDAGDICAQNVLAWLLGATEEMLTPVPSVSAAGETSFTAAEDGYYYATYEKTPVEQLTVKTSAGRSRSYTKVSHGYTLELGYCTAGTTVNVTNTENETVAMTVYHLNEDAVAAAYETLQAQTMQLEEYSDTKVCGNIEVTEAGRLIFSVAAEAGWTLLVDGKETEPETFAGAFISVHLEPGVHKIELRYATPGFYRGAAISAGSIALAALTLLAGRKRKLPKRNVSQLLDT